MVAHYRLVPDREGLPLDISMEALRLARQRQTNIPGDIATDGNITAGGMQLTQLQIQGLNIKAAIDAMQPQIDQARKDAAAAATKADQMASQITDVKKTVTDQGVRLEGAIKNADAAVSASSETRQSLTRLSATVENHYTEFKDGQASSLDRVSKVEQSVSKLSATVENHYAEQGNILTRQSKLEQDVDKFKTTVSQTYETKQGVTTKVSSAVSQSAKELTASFNGQINGLNGRLNQIDYIKTTIVSNTNGVYIRRYVNGKAAWNQVHLSSQGRFQILNPAGSKVMAALAQNLLQVNGSAGESRLVFSEHSDKHFWLTLYPLNYKGGNNPEPPQHWQTGWQNLPLKNCGSGSNLQYGYRGGIICFRGMVYAPIADAGLMLVNKGNIPPYRFTMGANRHYTCWGRHKNGSIGVANVYIKANQFNLWIGGGDWEWVDLNNLMIAT